eukprot:scaffold8767_cov91-Skeletonema_dohrnii-CCMP3373.AAC.1
MVGIIKNGSFWLRFPTQILNQNATEELKTVCGRSTWHIRHIYGPRCDRRWVPGVKAAIILSLIEWSPICWFARKCPAQALPAARTGRVLSR